MHTSRVIVSVLSKSSTSLSSVSIANSSNLLTTSLYNDQHHYQQQQQQHILTQQQCRNMGRYGDSWPKNMSKLDRVNNLLRGGFIKKPVWYDDVIRSPPPFLPYVKPPQPVQFPQDRLIKNFIKKHPIMRLEMMLATPGDKTISQRFAERQLELIELGQAEEYAFNNCEQEFAEEIAKFQTRLKPSSSKSLDWTSDDFYQVLTTRLIEQFEARAVFHRELKQRLGTTGVNNDELADSLKAARNLELNFKEMSGDTSTPEMTAKNKYPDIDMNILALPTDREVYELQHLNRIMSDLKRRLWTHMPDTAKQSLAERVMQKRRMRNPLDLEDVLNSSIENPVAAQQIQIDIEQPRDPDLDELIIEFVKTAQNEQLEQIAAIWNEFSLARDQWIRAANAILSGRALPVLEKEYQISISNTGKPTYIGDRDALDTPTEPFLKRWVRYSLQLDASPDAKDVLNNLRLADAEQQNAQNNNETNISNNPRTQFYEARLEYARLIMERRRRLKRRRELAGLPVPAPPAIDNTPFPDKRRS